MRISVTAERAWGFFQQNKRDNLCEPIAENPDYGIVVWLSNCDGNPDFQVTADNDIIFEEFARDERDCRETCKYIYEEYLTERVVQALAEMEASSKIDESEFEEREIEEREEDLDLAIGKFVDDVLDTDLDILVADPVEVLDDLKDHFLEYMARRFGLPIRRPMYLEDEDGEEFFVQYPYDCMIYEDDDNPLYQ